MLHIKQKNHLSLPQLHLSRPKPVQFSPAAVDDDELTQDIINDKAQHDDEWELNERPDETQLERYWTEVENDIQHDPQWITFSNEENT